MRRLIINADDLGMNPQRSHGIFQCFEFGIVTSASIIPNTSDSLPTAKHAREKGLPAGLHVNLTQEYPLSKAEDIASLLDGNGAFLTKDNLRRALVEEEIQKEHLERELRAQLEWMFDAYGAPDHVDGHHHIHLYPLVAQVITPLLERYGIGWARIPLEEPLPPFGYIISEEQLEKTQRINEQARIARDIYQSHGIRSTDHFRGLTLVGNASLKNMRHILNKLPEGITELMVHPGSQTAYGTPFDLDPQRQTELRMLTDEGLKEFLKEKKIELCSFGDLPSLEGGD